MTPICSIVALLSFTPNIPGNISPACIGADVELAGNIGVRWPDTGIQKFISLPRAKISTGLAIGPVSGHVAVAAVRSGGDAGYIGIDGESPVLQVQRAEARLTYAPWGLAVSLGILEDPWVQTLDEAWTLRPISAGLVERLHPVSDLGAAVAWTAPRGFADMQLAYLSGEGFQFRERNDGKNLQGIARIRPLALTKFNAELLQLSFIARDGSKGIEFARDHRLGGAISSHILGRVDAGISIERAWGVDGDPSRTPLGLSSWAVVHPWGPLLAYGRSDVWFEQNSQQQTWTTGAGVTLGHEFSGTAILGWEGRRTDEQLQPIAGAEALEREDRLFLLLSAHFRGAGPIHISGRI